MFRGRVRRLGQVSEPGPLEAFESPQYNIVEAESLVIVHGRVVSVAGDDSASLEHRWPLTRGIGDEPDRTDYLG